MVLWVTRQPSKSTFQLHLTCWFLTIKTTSSYLSPASALRGGGTKGHFLHFIKEKAKAQPREELAHVFLGSGHAETWSEPVTPLNLICRVRILSNEVSIICPDSQDYLDSSCSLQYYLCLVGERLYRQAFIKQKCVLFFRTVSLEGRSTATTMSFCPNYPNIQHSGREACMKGLWRLRRGGWNAINFIT